MPKTRLALLIMLAGSLAACGESSTLQVADGTGPSPKLPEPNKTL
ncbi:sorbosone dehydrogenase family protein, partial [Pseudomonas carnis]|nr:sorbosone dehydrogenase family protein [Pseudomonas carnis]